MRRTTPAPPVRAAHIGLGAFFRAHQAWYTARATDAGEWGIAAFTGRSPETARALAAQDGLYHLVTRGAEADTVERIDAVVGAYDGNDTEALGRVFGDPDLSVVTVTITEAGYRAGAPVLDRLVAALAARRRSGAGPLAVVPCDNVPRNGRLLAGRLADAAGAADHGMRGWLGDNVTFVSTVVDRITPASTDEVRATVRRMTATDDAMPIATEPFAEWVLAGDFPAGRPTWEAAGAQFVDDVAPYENRKLWMLNAAHSLLAYAGSASGHATVAEATADDVLRRRVREWWAEAGPHVGIDAASYSDALLARWSNRRIEHRLAQIAADGSQKLPVRVLPVANAELARGREPVAAAGILAAWIAHLRGAGAPVVDPLAESLVAAAGGPLADAVPRVLALLAPEAEQLAPLVRRWLE
ncbi:MAG: Mannitol dehydrogenase domain protein [Frankiales bacterium]|nr:Mannitol dehydrogenase domain protein [Frankiales bacterium]